MVYLKWETYTAGIIIARTENTVKYKDVLGRWLVYQSIRDEVEKQLKMKFDFLHWLVRNYWR
jgi:hypothetical protein